MHLIYRGQGDTLHTLWKINGQTTIAVPKQVKRIVGIWGRALPLAKKATLTTDPVYWIE